MKQTHDDEAIIDCCRPLSRQEKLIALHAIMVSQGPQGVPAHFAIVKLDGQLQVIAEVKLASQKMTASANITEEKLDDASNMTEIHVLATKLSSELSEFCFKQMLAEVGKSKNAETLIKLLQECVPKG